MKTGNDKLHWNTFLFTHTYTPRDIISDHACRHMHLLGPLDMGVAGYRDCAYAHVQYIS